jgi:hypothetical protein
MDTIERKSNYYGVDIFFVNRAGRDGCTQDMAIRAFVLSVVRMLGNPPKASEDGNNDSVVGQSLMQLLEQEEDRRLLR